MSRITKAIAIAGSLLKTRDGSHDLDHAIRVMNLALDLAKTESITDTQILERIQLAALFHDIKDAKYNENYSVSIPTLVSSLGSNEGEEIKHIIDHISYSKEIKQTTPVKYTIDMAIVQDADRLDALGAIGIARCFMYAGVAKESMQDALTHMTNKLEDVVKRMKTTKGKELAQERFKRVKDFGDALRLELLEKSI